MQTKNKENKLVWAELHDFKRGKKRFKSDLIPAALLIDRYFAAERDAIAALEAELASLEQQLDENREEESGEEACWFGFTGMPLLRRDKQTTRDVFGTYIHTYKLHEAVADKVILDLKYEARDVPQRLSSPDAIDAWFEHKTKA